MSLRGWIGAAFTTDLPTIGCAALSCGSIPVMKTSRATIGHATPGMVVQDQNPASDGEPLTINFVGHGPGSLLLLAEWSNVPTDQDSAASGFAEEAGHAQPSA